MHTDIRPIKLFESWIPQKWHPYLYLARLDRPIGTWLLLLPGWWTIMAGSGGLSGWAGSGAGIKWKAFLLFGIGAVLMRAAGCVINDLWDRKYDAHVERTTGRPLASGDLSPKQALFFLAGLLGLSLLILVQFNTLTILLGFLALVPVILYPLAKRFIFWPQAVLGLTFNFSALMGWTAVQYGLTPAAFLIFGGAFFWTMGYDTIYAHQDKEDDARLGLKSTALKLGARSREWVAGFYALSWLLLVCGIYAAGAGKWAVPALIPAGAHLIWQVESWDFDAPDNCLKRFRSNRDAGLLVLAGIAAAFALKNMV